MTPEQFLYWMQGYLAGGQVHSVQMLIDKTNEVIAVLEKRPSPAPAVQIERPLFEPELWKMPAGGR
jgi:hypothetical protein